MDKTIARNSFCVVFIENRKARSVVTNQTVKGRKPEITVRRLRDSADAVLRQSVVGRKRIKTILRRSCLNKQQKRAQNFRKKPKADKEPVFLTQKQRNLQQATGRNKKSRK